MKFKLTLFLMLITTFVTASDWTAELRAAYLYPSGSRFREVYNDGGLEGQFEVARRLYDRWHGWGNITYFQRAGRSTETKERTRINIVPLSVGFKYELRCYDLVHPYVGFGGCYSFVTVHDHTEGKKHFNRQNFGFVAKSGLIVNFTAAVIGDFFVDYMHQRIRNYHRHYVDVGGFKFGAGIGYRF